MLSLLYRDGDDILLASKWVKCLFVCLTYTTFDLQSFWMDNQTRKQQNKEFIPLESNSVPLYDRGYALGLTSAEGSNNVEE